MLRLTTVLCPVVLWLGAATILGGESPGGREILSERSVWRTHITWGPVLMQGPAGLQTPRDGSERGGAARALYGAQGHSEPPPQDWAQPDFKDASWGFWREMHAPGTLNGGPARLYDNWQYGVQQSSYIRRRCLRGGFTVDDPGAVRKLSLSVVYRGGVVAYLNGKEVGRGHVSAEASADVGGVAEPYADDVHMDPSGKPWKHKNGVMYFDDAAGLEDFNQRMRQLTLEVPASALRKGLNVLALDVRVAPCSEKVGFAGADWWSACGVAGVSLRGEGALASAAERPAGVQVWTVSPLCKVSPFGNFTPSRVGNGAQVQLYNFPLCWAPATETPAPIRVVGTRNGVFTGQVVVSSGSAVRGLKAAASDLVQSGGGGKIPAANCQVGYMTFPAEPPAELTDVSVSMLDVLHEKPPAEVAPLSAKPQPAMGSYKPGAPVSWCEGGATVPVWLRVRVPKDAPEGEYTGTLTVSADGLKPTAVPVSLRVHGYVLPDPRDFTARAALVHSPDSIALQYNVPLWSDRHFALMDRTCSYMGELGGSVVFIPLVQNTWLGNKETLVQWAKDGGGWKGDFKLFDRYLDMVQKHLKPRAVILYVYHPASKGKEQASVSAPGGSTPAPAYGPTPEATAFWKPVIAETLSRLKQRGLDKCVLLGTTIESGGRGNEDVQKVVDLFKEVWPEGKWADLAHYGAQKGNICGVPYGYTMSVWGNKTPFKSKKWGLSDLPLVVVKHYRGDPIIDLRPIASRGVLLWATERAMSEAQGIGPLGMDFWNFPGLGWQGKPAPVEGRVTNLEMNKFSTAAFLAPDAEGPVPTARFEMFRQGLQACEARALIESARENGKLGGDLAKRCEDVVKRRENALLTITLGERSAQGEGWGWFEASGWEDLNGELFAVAGEVAKTSSGR